MLTIEEVTKTYHTKKGDVAAVQQISLTVENEEAVAIRGPSGCGKTTLLLLAGALMRPSAGRVTVAGHDPYQQSANARSKFRADHIGFVFQQFHLIPYLNVLQNILTANIPTRRPQAQQRANQLVEQFGLTGRAHHVPAELSVGEKQRVALARALFNQPQLLLADEPTGNLDPDNATVVLDALRHFAEQGGAVLMVTHDPIAATRASRVVQLDQGQLVTS